MASYGIVDLFVSFYLWLTILWDAGTGYNNYNKQKGLIVFIGHILEKIIYFFYVSALRIFLDWLPETNFFQSIEITEVDLASPNKVFSICMARKSIISQHV